jgi:phospholipase C
VEAPLRPIDSFNDRAYGSTRRTFLIEGAGALAASSLAGRLLTAGRGRLARAVDLTQPSASQAAALQVLGRSSMRLPDSLPNPALASATDTMPQIEHVVVLMMENHSYDNFLGMLGRGPGRQPRGDGFTLGLDGIPTATNPYPSGQLQRAYHMPTTCQTDDHPSQEWENSHIQYDNGRNDGFVISASGACSMGYWQQQDLPFTYDLATKFPIGDRWFCSVLGQTDPNRRYLIAATSAGMTDDIGEGAGNFIPDASLPLPANGTIFERLTAAGIGWANYNTTGPTGTTMELYPTDDAVFTATNAPPIAQFFTDAAAGTLPSFSLLDPNYDTQSQENPQNIVVGESFLRQVVEAIGSSPAWLRTLLIITYDEHGGYYDHVPPPAALAPDAIPPMVQPGESTYDGFQRYGFRVPSILVGPYAKSNYVSHVVYDHTSILAFIERKWNLSALTYRDANANDLTDFLDLNAMAAGQPTFPELPSLAPSGENAATLACMSTGAGAIPPAGSILPAPKGSVPIHLKIKSARISRHLHGLAVELETDRNTLSDVHVELRYGKRTVASARVAHVSTKPVRVVLREHREAPPSGRYELIVRVVNQVLARRDLTLR